MLPLVGDSNFKIFTVTSYLCSYCLCPKFLETKNFPFEIYYENGFVTSWRHTTRPPVNFDSIIGTPLSKGGQVIYQSIRNALYNNLLLNFHYRIFVTFQEKLGKNSFSRLFCKSASLSDVAEISKGTIFVSKVLYVRLTDAKIRGKNENFELRIFYGECAGEKRRPFSFFRDSWGWIL